MVHKNIAVVGGGIIGAAVAALLTQTSPNCQVTLYEKETEVGIHQTGHNSGVVHAGLYYTPGGLKAQLTRRGVDLLKRYAHEKSLSYIECGKVVVAHTAEEKSRLQDILATAKANNVPDVRIVDRKGLKEIEPHCEGIAALHSPHTAIVDYPAVTRALVQDVIDGGGEVKLGEPVHKVLDKEEFQEVHSLSTVKKFDYVIVCNGLQSDRLAQQSGVAKYPKIIPFSGDYFRLVPHKTDLVNGLIYPVPDPNFPFLGVHLTRTVTGDVTIGPNAFLAFAREIYHRRAFSLKDSLDVASTPAFWKFAASNMSSAVDQLKSSTKGAFLKGAQSFIPTLTAKDVISGTRGVRAQAMNQDGTLADDFIIQREGNSVFVRNAPSPAATSALAIAEYIINTVLAEDRLVTSSK